MFQNEYEKWRMRQNPVTSRIQVGGRQMPSWFSSSLVQNRNVLPPPPPLGPPPQDESEYEEIDHLPRYTNTRPPAVKRSCSLCGNPNPVVCCEMCNSQIFCGSCNDMYHRHPKRHNHIRKLLDPPFESRPPLPPKTAQDTPVPPPRRFKKLGIRSATSSPTFMKKMFSDPFGSLRRGSGMEQRPLPPPPKPAPPLPPKSMTLSQQQQHFQRQASSQSQRNIPLTVMEMNNQAQRNNFMNDQQQINFPWANDNRNFPHQVNNAEVMRGRSQSISTSQLDRFSNNSSTNLSHIATLQRKPRRPIICGPPRPPPPPIPPREYPQQQQQQQHHHHPHHSVHSASAFNLNQLPMDDSQFDMSNSTPWIHGQMSYPISFQQQQMQQRQQPHQRQSQMSQFYPGNASPIMKRTPSSSSMTNSQMGSNQPIFNPWSTIRLAESQSLTASERELAMINTRSEPPPPYGNQLSSQHQLQHDQMRTVSHHDMMKPLNISRHHSYQDNEFQSFDKESSISPPPPMNHRDSFSRNNDSRLKLNRNNSKNEPLPEFWQCEWCTLINSYEKNICSVCCKSRKVATQVKASSPNDLNDSTHMNLDPNSHMQVISKPSPAFLAASPSPGTSGSGVKTPSTSPKKSNAVVRSTLTFSRNDKDKTGGHAHVEKQIIKVSASDDDDDVAGDPSSSSSSEEQLTTHHRESYHRQDRKKIVNKSKTPLTSSNEHVYGSVPLQTLTISPMPEFIEPKRKVSTGVGSSPPGSTLTVSSQHTAAVTSYLGNIDVDLESKQNHREREGEQDDSGRGENLSKKSSQSPDSKSFKANHVIELKKMSSTQASTSPSPSSASTSTTTMATSPTPQSFTKPSSPSFSFEPKLKSSKGTSPPPQSISTQTYEELPTSKMGSKSTSRSSIMGVGDPLEEHRSSIGGRTVKEMSDKELRYTRKAQQQSKLKRSMSTHLTSAATGDPWMEANEGRHLYRSSSRHSLASDTRSLPLSGPPSRESSPPARGRGFYQDFRSFGPPSWDRFPSPADYFASIDDLVNRHRKDSGSIRLQETELAKLLKEAAESNFSPEDVQVALRMCGERNPIKWLQDNWGNMVETVQTLATKYGREKGEEKNEVGTVSIVEARESLRQNKGNVWLSVTDCVEQRRKKFLELQARGNFLREDILTALTANHGKLDSAYVELSKAQLKPFLMQMQIWGPPMGMDNESAPYPPSSSSSTSGDKLYTSNAIDKISCSAPPSPAILTTIDNAKQNDNSADSIVDGEKEGNVNLVSTSTESEAKEVSEQESEMLHLLPKTLLLDFEPSAEELQRLQTKRSSLEDEQFMDATEGILGLGVDDFLVKDNLNSCDPEESEAFVSDLLQNFQVGVDINPQPEPETTATPSFSTTEINLENKGNVSSQETAVNQTNVITMSFTGSEAQLPQSSSSFAISPLKSTKSGSEDEKQEPVAMNLNSEINVQSKLQFSMEAVLELLDQQRIKLLKEQQQLKNKEMELEHMMKLQEGQLSREAINEKLAFEQKLSLLSNPLTYPTLTSIPPSMDTSNDMMTNLKPSLVASQRLAFAAAKIELQEDQGIKVQDSRKQNVDIQRMTQDGIDGSMKNVKGNTFDRRLSTDSAEGSVGGGGDISIYEEVDNGENFSITEYLSTQVEQNQGEIGVSQDSEEEEEEDDEEEDEEEEGNETREDDADLSMDSMDSEEESIETHSELSEAESEDEMMEKVYEKIEQLGAKHKPMPMPMPMPTDIDLQSLATTSANPQATAENEKQKTELKQVKPEIKRLMDMDSGLSNMLAERAVQLMDMKFTEEDSVYAAKECSSIYAALSYLQQDCLLCAGKFSVTQMISMLRCTHWCCKSCAKDYFIVQLRDHGILDATCPFCKEPSNLLEDPDVAAEYFNHLDILLKNLLDDKHHEMFQRKLRDWTLAKTPNFKWCSKCSSGFITEPLQTRLVCPDCSAVTCAVCLEPWDRTHDHRGQSLVHLCDSDATKSIVDYLNENCIECPRCRLKFALARGGCMHLTCSQCKFEFCSGCSAQFRLSSKCHEGPFCEKLGLHAHHPRNCLFYLRDKEPAFLAQLLEENAIPYLSETGNENDSNENNSEGQTVKRRCRVSIQKETEAGLQDDVCGNDAPPGFASVCQAHYIEYLGLLIWQNHLDPISILSNDDLETIIKRAKGHVKCPGRPYGMKEVDYRVQLLQVINDEIPL